MTSPVNAYNDFEGMRRYAVEGMDPHPISVTSLIKVIAPPTGLVKWMDKKIVNTALEVFESSGDIDKARYEGLEARWESSDEADLGTSVHWLAEVADSKLLGREVTVGTIADEKKLKPYVAQWEKARDGHQMQILAVEATLVNLEYNYAGTADRICIVPSISSNPIVLDLKSGKNVYQDVGLQCAALSRCTHLLNGDGSLEKVPWKLSQIHGAVAHVRPRSCRIYPLNLTKSWDYFKPLPMLAEWKSEKIIVVGGESLPDEDQLRRAELRRKIASLPPDIVEVLRKQIKENELVKEGSTSSWNETQLDVVESLFKPFEAEARARKERIRDKYHNLSSLKLSLLVLDSTAGRTASIEDLTGEEVDRLLEK